jgi:hypothetical protein
LRFFPKPCQEYYLLSWPDGLTSRGNET